MVTSDEVSHRRLHMLVTSMILTSMLVSSKQRNGAHTWLVRSRRAEYGRRGHLPRDRHWPVTWRQLGTEGWWRAAGPCPKRRRMLPVIRWTMADSQMPPEWQPARSSSAGIQLLVPVSSTPAPV